MTESHICADLCYCVRGSQAARIERLEAALKVARMWMPTVKDETAQKADLEKAHAFVRGALEQ